MPFPHHWLELWLRVFLKPAPRWLPVRGRPVLRRRYRYQLSALPTVITPTSTYFYIAPTLGSSTPTPTPSVTGTIFTPTIDPTLLAHGCNNLVFVRDVTVPSGTKVKPGEDFGKTWKVANVGTCDWMYQYAIVLISGDAMSGKTTKLGRVVTAGHWGELTVEMGAPKSPGTYTAYWRLSDADGNPFGASLPVSIVV